MEKTRYSGFLSGSALKLIAAAAMLVDHIGAFAVDSSIYPEVYNAMRTIGRISFPIFCFLLVQGFINTRSIRRYLLRLFIFAIISEVPFDLVSASSFGTNWGHQNVFFTLLIGLSALAVINRYKNNNAVQIITIAAACVAAYALKTDYSYFGVMQIVIFYYMQNIRLYKIFSITLLNMCMRQPAGALALVFTELYNGKRGMNMKYFMYAFYPVHLLIIWFINAEII